MDLAFLGVKGSVICFNHLKVTEDKLERTPASKSLISKYFVKGTAAVTRSVQKKQEALKNM